MVLLSCLVASWRLEEQRFTLSEVEMLELPWHITEEGIKAKRTGHVRADSLYNAIKSTSQLYAMEACRTLFTKAVRNVFTEGTSIVKKLSVVVTYRPVLTVRNTVTQQTKRDLRSPHPHVWLTEVLHKQKHVDGSRRLTTGPSGPVIFHTTQRQLA